MLGADFRAPADNSIAEAVTEFGDGILEAVGLEGFAETKLAGALLEVRDADTEEADRPAVVFSPRAIEEGDSGSVEVVGEFDGDAGRDGAGDGLEGRESQLEGDGAARLGLVREIGCDAFGLAAEDGAEAVAIGFIDVEGGLAGDGFASPRQEDGASKIPRARARSSAPCEPKRATGGPWCGRYRRWCGYQGRRGPQRTSCRQGSSRKGGGEEGGFGAPGTTTRPSGLPASLAPWNYC